jgi:hypothetical protein
MHNDYLEIIVAYLLLNHCFLFLKLFGIQKIKLCVIKVYGLIELVAYYYREVMSAVLEANREGTKKLSVLRMEQCEDG